MNNLTTQDSSFGLPSIPSLISNASELFGSGNFDFHTLSSLGSLARGESTLVHLLSGGWPLEEDSARNLPDGGTPGEVRTRLVVTTGSESQDLGRRRSAPCAKTTLGWWRYTCIA